MKIWHPRTELILTDFFRQCQGALEDFDKQLEEYAQSMIAQDMALYALARAEGIEAEDEYIEKAKQGILDSYGFESEKELKDSYG